VQLRGALLESGQGQSAGMISWRTLEKPDKRVRLIRLRFIYNQ